MSEYLSLLKEAAQLKNDKRYDEACQVLKVAYQSAGVGESVKIEDRLRLPMYFLLANKNNEGWIELNRLAEENQSVHAQILIREKMRYFSEDEGRWFDALFYAMWVWVLSINDLIATIKSMQDIADGHVEYTPQPLSHWREPYAYTSSGNPIYDVAYNHILSSLNNRLRYEIIEEEFEGVCQKIGIPALTETIADKLIEIIDTGDTTGHWVPELHEFLRSKVVSFK